MSQKDLTSKMLYTKEYKDQLKQKHKGQTWGGGVASKANIIAAHATGLGVTNMLDYGCGAGVFKKSIDSDRFKSRFKVSEYDPGIEGKDELPETHDYVVCVDVLEHIEPECLDDVLAHLALLMRVGGYFLISTVPAFQDLPDGRNAHLIIEPAEWWEKKLSEKFELTTHYIAEGACAYFIKKP